MSAPRSMVAGNWKMNGLKESHEQLDALGDMLTTSADADCDVLLCPPFTLVASFAATSTTQILIGGQDCHTNISGAHTGDVSAQMLADSGASHVIVGHSERRADHGEQSELVAQKAAAGIQAGLVAIVCVGETEAERDAGNTLEVVLSQVAESIPDSAEADNIIIAYEPVWAIGTGRTPTTEDVAEVHAAIRKALNERFGEAGNAIAILYGGSVKPANAVELMGVENVNGALVGGASLKATDFNGIIDAYRHT